MDLSGSASGQFAQYLGSGTIDLQMTLTGTFGSNVAASALGSTLANLSGKFPATLATGPTSQLYYAFTSSTTIQALLSKGIYSLKVNKRGIFTGSLTHEAFQLYENNKYVAMTGSFTATSGTVSVIPVTGTSPTPQPDIMVMANPRVVLGCQVYQTVSPGTSDPFYTILRRGATTTKTFLIQNDGPSTDMFLFESGAIVTAAPSSTGFTITAYDGKTKIPASELATTGYPVTLAPGAVKVINVRITATRPDTKEYYLIPFSASRSADGANIDWAAAAIYVP